MANQLGNESTLYLCNETSGLMQDSVSGLHATGLHNAGGITYNGNSITLVDSYFDWGIGVTPINVFSDFSFYIMCRVFGTSGAGQGPTTAVNTPITSQITPATAGSFDATQIRWDSLNAPPAGMRFYGSFTAGDPFVQLQSNTAAIPTPSDIFVCIYSYNLITKTIEANWKSLGGIDVSGTDTKPAGMLPDDEGFRIFGGHNGADHRTHAEVYQMGGFTTAYGLTDLQDTASALLGLAVNNSPTGVFNSVTQR